MPIIVESEPVPTGEDVARFLGQGDNTRLVALAQEHVTAITLLAKAYTRGRGFTEGGEPASDVAAVIVTATARLVTNPSQIAQTNGPFTVNGGFRGWSLAELSVLDRYRRRAM